MATTKASTATAAKTSAAKKPAAVKKTVAKKPAVKKTVATKTTAKKSKPSPEALYKMTEVAAYYIALNDSFSGNPSEYWLQAEIQISRLHKSAGYTNKPLIAANKSSAKHIR